MCARRRISSGPFDLSGHYWRPSRHDERTYEEQIHLTPDFHGFHCSWYDVHPVGFSGVLGGSLLYITGRTFDVDLSKTLAAGPNTNLQEFVDLCSTAANAQF